MAVGRARDDSAALGGVVNGYPPLDASLYIPAAYLPSGTSFPSQSAFGNNRPFWRTDRALNYYYDGTRWLTVNEYVAVLGVEASFQDGSTPADPNTATDFGANGQWITRYSVRTITSGGGAIGSNYVTWQLRSISPTITVHNIGSSFATNADTSGNWTAHTAIVEAAVTSGDTYLGMGGTKTGSPTLIQCVGNVFYRLIG